MIIDIFVIGLMNYYVLGCSGLKLKNNRKVEELKQEIENKYDNYLKKVCPENNECRSKISIYSPNFPENTKFSKTCKNEKGEDISCLKMLYNENTKIAKFITENNLLFIPKQKIDKKEIQKNDGKDGKSRWFTLYGNVYDLTKWFKIHNHALGIPFKTEAKKFNDVSGNELGQGECAVFRSHIFVEPDYRKETVLTLLINNRIGEVKNYKGIKLYPTLDGMQEKDGKVYEKDPDWGDDDW